jgi:hypothetical protein
MLVARCWKFSLSSFPVPLTCSSENTLPKKKVFVMFPAWLIVYRW